MDSEQNSASDQLSQTLSGTALPEAQRLQRLLERAQGGDQEAAGELWRLHQPRLELCVRQRLGRGLRQRAMLETLDIVQDTFAKAQQKIGDVKIFHRSSLLDWLARIAENRICDWNDNVNARKRNPPGGIQALDAPIEADSIRELFRDPVADDTLPEDHAVRQELIDQVQDTISSLKQEWQDVIYLRSYLQLPWGEVAERMQLVSPGAAKQLFLRAKLRLASELDPGADPGSDLLDP